MKWHEGLVRHPLEYVSTTGLIRYMGGGGNDGEREREHAHETVAHTWLFV